MVLEVLPMSGGVFLVAAVAASPCRGQGLLDGWLHLYDARSRRVRSTAWS